MFLALFELALYRHKKDLYDYIRGLLEVGDAQNGNKDYVYVKFLCAIIKHKIRGKNRCLDFVKKWKIRFENESYLNRKFVEWCHYVRNEIKLMK